MKRAIRPVVRLWLLHWYGWLIRWYRWAQREIHPLHPDVPLIVQRLHQLKLDRERVR